MRSPQTMELHVTIAEVGIAVLIGAGLAMTGIMTSLEAHRDLLRDWLLHGGAIALGAGIGAGLGWWWSRHHGRPTGRHPSLRPMATANQPRRARPSLRA